MDMIIKEDEVIIKNMTQSLVNRLKIMFGILFNIPIVIKAKVHWKEVKL